MSLFGHVLPLMIAAFFLGMAIKERQWRRETERQTMRLSHLSSYIGKPTGFVDTAGLREQVLERRF